MWSRRPRQASSQIASSRPMAANCLATPFAVICAATPATSIRGPAGIRAGRSVCVRIRRRDRAPHRQPIGHSPRRWASMLSLQVPPAAVHVAGSGRRFRQFPSSAHWQSSLCLEAHLDRQGLLPPRLLELLRVYWSWMQSAAGVDLICTVTWPPIRSRPEIGESPHKWWCAPPG